MTYEMEYVAHLFSCGARGAAAEPPRHPVNWNRIEQLAAEQSITYTVALAVKNASLGCPDVIRERMTARQRSASVKNYLRIESVLDTVARMESVGIPAIMLKGIDAAACYASPECRVSVDTDLLIRPEDENKALRFLSEQGFENDTRKKGDLHSICGHPEMGIIELHISLMTESRMEEFSGSSSLNARAFGRSVMKSVNGQQYRALGPTDCMLFLTYHMLSHLVTSGISLRMLMDNALYSVKNAGGIDREQYAAELAATGYSRAARLLFGTASKYFGIPEECFPAEPVTDPTGMETVMSDLEEGGWEGYINKGGAGIRAWQIYRHQTAENVSDKKAIGNIRRSGRLLLRNALFPGRNKMTLSYPVLKKHIGLYPFCWLHRLFKEGVPWLDKGGLNKVMLLSDDESKLPDDVRNRLDIYHRLSLLDGGKGTGSGNNGQDG